MRPPDSDDCLRTRPTWAEVAAYLLFFTSAIAYTIIVPLLPVVQHSHDLDAAGVAWILALPSVASIVTAAPLGILGDRIGSSRLIVASGLVMAVATIAHGIPSLSALLIARFALGVGFGALWTPGLAWLAGIEIKDASRRIAVAVTASSIGFMVGPLLAGISASRFGWAAPFVLAGTAIAVVTVLLLVAPRGCRTVTPIRSAAAPDGTGSKRRRALFGVSTFRVLRRPPVLAGATTLTMSAGIASLLQLLVPLDLHSRGHSAEEIGVVLSVGALAYIGVSSFCMYAGRRLTTLRVNAYLAGTLALSLVPAVAGTGIGWVTAAVMLNAFPRAAINTAAFGLAAAGNNPAGPGRGAVIGVLNTLWSLATVSTPVIAGVVITVIETRWIYAVAALVVGATALWLVREVALDCPGCDGSSQSTEG